MPPVHGIVPFTSMEETVTPDLKGFLGHRPVRVGNQAAEQVQNDVYGSVVLAATQMFVDERLTHMGDEALFRLLETLGESALSHAFEPDAGLWEYRGRARVHTYSATMCWAACDRLGQHRAPPRLADRAILGGHARAIRERLLAGRLERKARRADRRARLARPRRQRPAGRRARPSAAERPAFRKTCETIGRELMRNGRIMRYAAPDDFGAPETAFLACNFWYIDALYQIGRKDEARELFEAILARRNAFGLLSEDIHPDTGELWGNLPQTYSMAGIINTATRLSSSWEDAWARA